jgi:hypothetical protein
MTEFRHGESDRREKTFMESAKLAMKRFYYKQLDPMIIVRRVKRWYYSDEFSPKGDSAHEVLAQYIENRFDYEVHVRDNPVYGSPYFRKVAYWYLSHRLPLHACTRRALESDPSNVRAIQNVMDSFISRFEAGDIGWSYKETKSGTSQLAMRDGEVPLVLETTNAHVPMKKESDARRFDGIMKDLFG